MCQLDGTAYLYAELVALLKGIHYDGWLLIGASDDAMDRVEALSRQREVFDKLVRV